MLKINNESPALWCVVLFLGWAFLGVVIGIPLHIGFGISLTSVALFVGIQFALNIVASPWLFSARATANNPGGCPLRFAVAATVWLTLASLAASLQLLDGDFTDRTAVAAFLGTPFVLGSIALLAVWKFRGLIDPKYRT